ncbi:MAG: nucleotidyltransferase domain-containing protein [Pseudomonadota bacterium]
MPYCEKCGLNGSTVDRIIEIVLLYKLVEKIVIFGSRATGNFNETSDIDVAIFSKGWTSTDINIVKDRLENVKIYKYPRCPIKLQLPFPFPVILA